MENLETVQPPLTLATVAEDLGEAIFAGRGTPKTTGFTDSAEEIDFDFA